MDKLKKVFDIKTIKFLVVGLINTLIGTVIMFSCYNLLGMSYWFSSAANYVLASIVSYILNKYWTFQNRDKSLKVVVKFIFNILICYLLAYTIAKPLVINALNGFGKNVQDNAAMFVGTILFTLFNYFGQRFFAFKE